MTLIAVIVLLADFAAVGFGAAALFLDRWFHLGRGWAFDTATILTIAYAFAALWIARAAMRHEAREHVSSPRS